MANFVKLGATDWRAFLVLVAVICLALWPVFTGRFYAIGDMRDVTIPLETFFHNEELAGRLPAWNPDAAFGFPVMAAAQIGFFYPPLLLLRLLPVPVYLPLIVALHIMFLGAGTMVLARRLGLSKTGALLAGISFSLSSFVWQHVTHLNVLLAVAWMPWQFIVAESLLKKDRWRLAQIATFALVIGIPFLAGQLQIQTFSTLVVVAYIIWERWLLKKKNVVLAICFSLILAFGISAGQLLPTYELTKFSSRGKQGSFDIQTANQYSWPLFHAPNVIWPRFFGHDDTYWGKHLEIEYGLSIGTIPAILALLAIVRLKVFRHVQLRFFAWLSLISFLLALGVLSPFRLVGIEPTLWIFSSPARWLLFTSFSLSLLSAYGFDHVQTIATKKFWVNTVIGLIAGVIIWNTAIFLVIQPEAISHFLPDSLSPAKTQFANQKLISLLHSARTSSISFTSFWTYLPVLAMLVVIFSFNKPKYKLALLAVTTIELLLLASSTNSTLPWKEVLLPPKTVALLPTSVTSGQARLYSIREGGDTGHYFTDPASRANNTIRAQQKELLVPLLNTQFHIPGVEWPASLDIQAVSNALAQMRGNDGYNIKNEETARNLNIGAILIPTHLSSSIPGTLNKTIQDVSIYELTPAPRAQFVPSKPTAGQTKVLYSTLSPSVTSINVEGNVPGAVIIRDTWYPGWQATVDGTIAPIQHFAPFFRSVAVPAGKHSIIMTYKPTLLYQGITISLMTILACCVMLSTRKHLT